jgi:hypothetical protein
LNNKGEAMSTIRKIEIFLDAGGKPGAIEVDGRLCEKTGACLKRIITTGGEIPKLIPNIIAWGGIVPHTSANPAQGLEQLVFIEKVLLRELDGNNNFDHHDTDKVLPTLRLLFWETSEHFTKRNSHSFECVVCGKIDIGIKKDSKPEYSPLEQCLSKACYSHKIRRIIGTRE